MKILTTMTYTAFILLLVVVAGIFLASFIPIPGHISLKIVKSGSMEPAIMTGSIVIVQPKPDYAVGDIITFGEDTKTQIPTTHRIASQRIDAGVTYYATKGDANNAPDGGEIRKDQVVGNVIFVIPYAGFVLNFARQPLGFTLMIAVPAGIIILDESIRIFREVMDLRRKKRVRQTI